MTLVPLCAGFFFFANFWYHFFEMHEDKNNQFSPKFFSAPAPQASNSASSSNSDPLKIKHFGPEKHSSNFAKKYGLNIIKTSRPLDFEAKNLNPVKVKEAIRPVQIDWARHETIMSDGSRISFGEKLTDAERKSGIIKK